MSDSEKQILSSDEDENLEEENVVKSKESNVEAKSSKIYGNISVEKLKRKPLHREKESLKREPERLYPDLSEYKETKQPSAPSGVSKSSYDIPVIGYLVAAIVVGLCIYMALKGPASPTMEKQLDVKRLVGNLKDKFGGQPSLTYRSIELALKRAVSDHFETPGILVLISSLEAKETTDKLAKTLVQSVSDPSDYVLIEAGTPLSAERLKKEIDTTIRGNLTETQVSAVLVRNLDRIPFEAAMIFHSYCDHENAPFKKALYVMTSLVEGAIAPDSDSKQLDTLASARLKAAWEDGGEDQVASLISRLTVFVAAVVPK